MADSALPTISIDSYSAYLGLRSCAGGCLLFRGALSIYATDLVSYIGCESGRYNTCYCNAGIATQVTSFVSSCVSKACSEVADASSAVQAWEGYCKDAGYPLGNVAVTTVETLTSGTVTQPTTLVATVPATVVPIVTVTSPGATSSLQPSALTAAPSSPSPGSNAQSTSTPASSVAAQSNTGAIAGGVVGGVVALGITAIIITMLILRERRRKRGENPAANAVWQPPAPPSPTTEKIVKTPAMVSSAPVFTTHAAPSPPVAMAMPGNFDRGSPLAGTRPELDSRMSRMRLGNELDGRGGFAIRGDANEMQG